LLSWIYFVSSPDWLSNVGRGKILMNWISSSSGPTRSDRELLKRQHRPSSTFFRFSIELLTCSCLAWAIENNEPADFENLVPEELNTVLAKFWSEVRKSNGDYYGCNSLFNLRAMINKHLKGKPYCVSFDIVTDERFRSSNERLEKQLKLLKGIGRTITHKQPISIADLRRMYDSGVLGTSNPLSLLRKVITLHNIL